MASIAVVGAGAVGSYYGALLARAGHDVRFLMRRDLHAVRAHGLTVESPLGGFVLRDVDAVGDARELGQREWVICALKTTALADAPALLAHCVGPETRVVALMNGLGVEEEFAKIVPPGRVFGAMAFVCINRGAPGVVHHLDYGRITAGHLQDDPGEAAALVDLLRGAGVDATTAADLRCARWEKLAWNVPFNGLSVAAGGLGTESILGDPPLRALAARAMRETIAAGNADLGARGSDARLDEEVLMAKLFAQTATMGEYRTSMALDYVHGRPLEVEAILGEPVRRAHELGMPVPAMEALYAIVRAADLRLRGKLRAIPADG